MGRTRRYTGVMATAERTITILFGIYCLLYLSGVLSRVGIQIYGVSHDAAILGFILFFTFLKIPAYKGAPNNRLPWYDALFIVLSLAGTFNIAINAVNIANEIRTPSQIDLVLGVVTIVLLIEAVRRAVSPILSILATVFFIYPLIADFAPGFLQRPSMSLSRVLQVQYLNPTGIFGSATHLVATLIIAFIIFGAFLMASGAGQSFINMAVAVAGRFRGGPAKVSVLGSALFGMVNGSTLANIATVGTVTIPLMKKVGYKPLFAAAIEAVASNGGPLTPPVMGATVFLMMSFLGKSYADLIIVAAMPAALYYLGLLMMVDQEAAKNGLKGLPPDQIPSLKQSLKESWSFIIPFAVIIYLLIGLQYSPETSAIYAIVSLVIASMFSKRTRMGMKKILNCLAATSQGLPEVGTAVAVAGILLGSFMLTGVGLTISQELVKMAHGNFTILVLLTGICCGILGMGLSVVAVYLIAAIFLVPALTMVGAPPLASHFFVMWVAQSALLTPPVCNAAFLAATIAEAPLMRTGWQACRLGVVIYLIPFFWMYDPGLLLVGGPAHVAQVVIASLAGVYCLTCGISGWMLREVSWPERVMFGIAGIALLFPNTYSNVGGSIWRRSPY